MRPDQDIALDATDRLHSISGLDDQDIAVRVIDGLVLLAGIARSEVERAQAVQAIKGVRGVMGLANHIEICPRTAKAPPDPEIIREGVAAIRHQFPDQIESLQLIVQNGRVQLEGDLPWHYQRDVIETIVRSVRGVVLVTNRIRVSERPLADERPKDIERL